MKFTKRVTVPEHERDELDYLQCDLCRVRTSRDENWPQHDAKRPTFYDVRATTINLEVGERYPDATNVGVTSYHLCVECFRSKLEPWLKAQGAAPTLSRIE